MWAHERRLCLVELWLVSWSGSCTEKHQRAPLTEKDCCELDADPQPNEEPRKKRDIWINSGLWYSRINLESILWSDSIFRLVWRREVYDPLSLMPSRPRNLAVFSILYSDKDRNSFIWRTYPQNKWDGKSGAGEVAIDWPGSPGIICNQHLMLVVCYDWSSSVSSTKITMSIAN